MTVEATPDPRYLETIVVGECWSVTGCWIETNTQRRDSVVAPAEQRTFGPFGALLGVSERTYKKMASRGSEWIAHLVARTEKNLLILDLL